MVVIWSVDLGYVALFCRILDCEMLENFNEIFCWNFEHVETIELFYKLF